MRKLSLILLALASVVSCGRHMPAPQDPHTKIENAVRAQLELYPASTLQDLYKSFFQAEFGAEHIVADTSSAGRYLDRELAIPDRSTILYEPIGADSSFFRVHLIVVQSGMITRQQLFDTFLGGVHEVSIPDIESWGTKWAEIESVIDSMGLNLPDYLTDKNAISAVLESGDYAMHHSQVFGQSYDPHYRIIRKDLFFKQLLPFLPKNPERSFQPEFRLP